MILDPPNPARMLLQRKKAHSLVPAILSPLHGLLRKRGGLVLVYVLLVPDRHTRFRGCLNTSAEFSKCQILCRSGSRKRGVEFEGGIIEFFKGRQVYFTFPSALDPVFKASKAPFLILRVATPSGVPRQAPLEGSRHDRNRHNRRNRQNRQTATVASLCCIW